MRFFGKSVRTPKTVTPLWAVGLLASIAAGAASAIWAGSTTQPPHDETWAERTKEQRSAGYPDCASRVEPVTADDVISWAINRLSGYRSVRATVKMSAYFFGHQLLSQGWYLEQRTGSLVRQRFELVGNLQGRPVGFTQVCDGHWLWRLEYLPDNCSASRIDVQQLEDTLANLRVSGKLGNRAKVSFWKSLAHLLAGLKAQYRFCRLRSARLPAGTIVWRLDGWYQTVTGPEVRQQKVQAGLASVGPVPPVGPHEVARPDGACPPQVPRRVVVYLDRRTAVPLRLEYRWERCTPEGQGRAVGHQRLVIEFSQVGIDWQPNTFANLFRPPRAEFVDRTDEYLDLLLK